MCSEPRLRKSTELVEKFLLREKMAAKVIPTVTPKVKTTKLPFWITKVPPVVGPRKFNPDEYAKFKDLPGMPKEIPQIGYKHYAAVAIPIVLLLALLAHNREANARDLADERSKIKRIKLLLASGVVFATLVVCVHMRIIPVRWVRKVFPLWKLPQPMSKLMKILILFSFLAFIVYPTAKFIRRRGMVEKQTPQVHKLVKAT